MRYVIFLLNIKRKDQIQLHQQCQDQEKIFFQVLIMSKLREDYFLICVQNSNKKIQKIQIINANCKMNKLKELISQIEGAKQQKAQGYKRLEQIIVKNQALILENDIKETQSSLLLSFILKRCNKCNNNEFYTFYYRLIEYIYQTKSPLVLLVYQTIPTLLTKYIQSIEQKYPALQLCIKVIYNNQYCHFNKNLISRELQIGKSGQIAALYKQHFRKSIKVTSQGIQLMQIKQQQQINSSNRPSVKTVLLLAIFNHLQSLSEKSILAYLWMAYIYCGGTQQQQQTGVSLYLLQKKNMFSIFKYYISIEEMSIILLTLYQLSMQRKKNKFELLSAINMIHKKAANQSMFKLSEVAQSTIHLLEDQYGDAFT